jgi:hypothetical protein
MFDVLRKDQDKKTRTSHLIRAFKSGQIFNHRVFISYLDIDLGYSKKVRSVIRRLTDENIELKTGQIIPIVTIFLIEF